MLPSSEACSAELEKVVGLFDAAGFELVRAVSIPELVASHFQGAPTHNEHAWTLHLERVCDR
jgi:hypothetical protein